MIGCDNVLGSKRVKLLGSTVIVIATVLGFSVAAYKDYQEETDLCLLLANNARMHDMSEEATKRYIIRYFSSKSGSVPRKGSVERALDLADINYSQNCLNRAKQYIEYSGANSVDVRAYLESEQYSEEDIVFALSEL